jgi:hypothetical protein
MATFLSATRLPTGELALSACAEYASHAPWIEANTPRDADGHPAGDPPAACPYDYAATWGKVAPDESDADQLARAVAEHAALTDARTPPAPAAVDLAALGVAVAGGAA